MRSVAERGAADKNAAALRISFISQWYAPELGEGGIPRGIATGLRDRGNQVEVLTGFPNYPEGKLYPGYRLRPYQRELLDDVPIHRAPLYYSHDSHPGRRAANYVSFAIASGAVALGHMPPSDVSLVYSSPITAAVPALALRAFRGNPFVLLIQDMWPQSVLASGFLSDANADRLERALHRMCDLIYRKAAEIAVTAPGMIELIAARGVAREKLHFVPNWADEAHYFPVASDDRTRETLGLTRKFTVMYAGNFGEVQGLDTVLSAAHMLRAHPDIGFALVGTGSAEESLRRIAADRQLDNVLFVPRQPIERMNAVLAAGDVQLVSLNDHAVFRSTLPSKIQSLLAAGRPIIGAVVGDAARVINDSGAGSSVPPGNAPALAKAVFEMSRRSADARCRLGSAGRRYYLSEFARDVSTTRLEKLLHLAARRQAKTRH